MQHIPDYNIDEIERGRKEMEQFREDRIKSAIQEQQKEKDEIYDIMMQGKIQYRWQDDPFFY